MKTNICNLLICFTHKYVISMFVVFSGFPLFALNTVQSGEKFPLQKTFELFEGNISVGRLNAAAELLSQIDFDAIEENEQGGFVRCLYNLSKQYHLQDNFDSSFMYSKLADSLIHKFTLHDPQILCELVYLKAWYYYKKSKINSARIEFENALLICNEVSNDSLKVLVLKYLGNIDFIDQNFNSASILYRKSLAIESTSTNPSDIIMSGLFQNIGIIHASKGEYDSARFYLIKAVTMKENILKDMDPILANGYLNLSLFLWQIGELIEALKYTNKAEDIFRKNYGPEYYKLIPLYLNKGTILITLQDPKEALSYYKLALELNKKYRHPNLKDYVLLANIGATYRQLGNVENAITHFKLALDQKPDSENEISILHSLAENYYENAEYLNAKKYYLQAIAKSNSYKGPASRYCASTFLDFGSYCDNTGNYEESILYFNKALEIYKSLYGEKNRKVCEALTGISYHYEKHNDYSRAMDYAQKALIAGIKEFNDTSFYRNPEIDQLPNDYIVFSALHQKAHIFNLYNNQSSEYEEGLKTTIEVAELAVGLLEKIKSSLKGEDAKILLSSKSNDIYNLVIEASAELYRITDEFVYLQKSFEYSEKGKAASLLANIREMEALEIADVPEDIRLLESALKTEMAQAQNVIFEEVQKAEPDTNKLARVRLVMYNKRMVHDSLTHILENNYPEYFNLKYNTDVITISSIQDKLAYNEAFIEYKVAGPKLFTYIVTSDSILLVQKNIGLSFPEKVQEYLALMNQFPAITNVKQTSNYFADLGFELFNNLTLNHPILADKEMVIIVPDNIIGYLGFDALVCSPIEKNNTGYSGLDYLVYKYALSYGYSGTLYFSGTEKRSKKKKVLAIAPKYEFSVGNPINHNMPGFSDLIKQLTPIGYIDEEVDNINQTFQGEVLKGDRATESNFKSKCNQFQILHFAMHALINDEHPLASKLIFTLNNNDTTNDGFLNTWEIYNLNLNADLAVLSACKTGTGKLSKGEGIMSLARGFMYAGVPSIVMTLWSIEDISSANIMKQFYQFMKEGKQKNIALQKAKLSYLKNANQLQSHPYFWAAYVQIGNKAPLSSSFPKVYYFILASLVLVFFLVVIFRKKWLKR